MLRGSFVIRLSLLLLISLTTHCTSNKTEEANTSAIPEATNSDFEVTEDKSSLAKLYELEHMKEWYPERILPPVFDYNMDLSGKTIVELSFLRNEIFARNGYLFDDAVLRGYFNQFKWYQPVFDVPDFKVQLNNQEQAFVDKVLKLENALAKERYVQQGNYTMINMDHVHNVRQFKKVDDNLRQMLTEKNFAIVQASHEQLFHVYDHNHYQYVPQFVTTDAYLQLMHKHLSTTLQKVEEAKFIKLITELLKTTYETARRYEQEVTDEHLLKSAQWATTYLAVGYTLITGKAQAVPEPMSGMYKNEISKIQAATGNESEFLNSNTIQYSQFKPRGNYTKTEELEKYFRCVKWLNTAPMYIDNDETFLSAVLIASFIKNSPEVLKAFERYNQAILFIVGEEDNLSMTNLIASVDGGSTSITMLAGKINTIREKVKRLEKNRITIKSGDSETGKNLAKPAILFTAGRYTFDAEILSRLIHVLRPEPKRTFPKGLDVFASLGNQAAENILLNEYNEAKQWKQYPDSLKKLRHEFSGYAGWDKNIYTKTFETIQEISKPDDGHPLFMKTKWWDKKNLITSLSAWAELKHDMLLYAEQPGGAQAGEGGGPPPPQHLGYVEPNVNFWKKALALIAFHRETLTEMELLDEGTDYNAGQLIELGTLLLDISKKELNHEPITPEEFDRLSWIGGSMEQLLFRIFGSGFLPEKERLVAEVADVYNYNGKFLEEGVGMIDEIYVVAEINGKPYLTKGAVFSYYEFISDSPLNDDEWKEQVSQGKAPGRPIWTTEITLKNGSLESKKEYSF